MGCTEKGDFWDFLFEMGWAGSVLDCYVFVETGQREMMRG